MAAVYLARAVDVGAPVQVVAVESLVAQALVELGHTVYLPSRAWVAPRLPGGPAGVLALNAVNEAARRAASVVVAIVSHNMVSVGVPAEIGASLAEGRRVVLLDLTPPTVPPTSYVLSGWLASQRSLQLCGLDLGEVRGFLEEHVR